MTVNHLAQPSGVRIPLPAPSKTSSNQLGFLFGKMGDRPRCIGSYTLQYFYDSKTNSRRYCTQGTGRPAKGPYRSAKGPGRLADLNPSSAKRVDLLDSNRKTAKDPGRPRKTGDSRAQRGHTQAVLLDRLYPSQRQGNQSFDSMDFKQKI